LITRLAPPMPAGRRRHPATAACMNPDDRRALGLNDGDGAEIATDTAAIEVTVEADETVRAGVVSISHGWGGLPDEADDAHPGVNTNLLVRCDRDVEIINAMPAMTAIPVKVRK